MFFVSVACRAANLGLLCSTFSSIGGNILLCVMGVWNRLDELDCGGGRVVYLHKCVRPIRFKHVSAPKRISGKGNHRGRSEPLKVWD